MNGVSAKNENGVYTDREYVELPLDRKGWRGCPLAEIRVALTPDGWRAVPAFNFSTGNMWGSCGPITDHDTPFPTREDAVADAARKLNERLSAAQPWAVEPSMEPQRRKILAWLAGFITPATRPAEQLDLFGAAA